jgi:CYTH domain-containing protein
LPSPLIETTHHHVEQDGRVWTIDVFDGPPRDLVLAEIATSDIHGTLRAPQWLGEEVTHDPVYRHFEIHAGEPMGWAELGTR